MKFIHLNLVVRDPEVSARFYLRYVLPNARCKWLGDSLHVRTESCDLAFQEGEPHKTRGTHHGFLADAPAMIDGLVERLIADSVTLSDNETMEGFRSIKFLDPDGYECEIYWEVGWPEG